MRRSKSCWPRRFMSPVMSFRACAACPRPLIPKVRFPRLTARDLADGSGRARADWSVGTAPCSASRAARHATAPSAPHPALPCNRSSRPDLNSLARYRVPSDSSSPSVLRRSTRSNNRVTLYPMSLTGKLTCSRLYVLAAGRLATAIALREARTPRKGLIANWDLTRCLKNHKRLLDRPQAHHADHYRWV